MMLALAVREYLPKTIQPIKIAYSNKLPYKQQWNIYMQGRYIGFTKVDIKEFSPSEFKVEIDAKVDDSIMPALIKGVIFLDQAFNLKTFHVNAESDSYLFGAEGEVLNGKLELTAINQNRETRITIPWILKDELIKTAVFPWFHKENLKIGDKYNIQLFNPLTQQSEILRVKVERSTFVYRKGKFVDVFVLKLKQNNFDIECWVDNKGNLAKIYTPFGWEFEAVL